MGQKRVDPVWSAWMTVGVIAAVVYQFLESTTVPAAVLYDVTGLSAVAMMVLGIRRHRPRNAAGWWVLAAGTLSWVVGDICYAVTELVFGLEPFPSVADYFYLGAYPIMVTALYLITRGRRQGSDLPGLIDAAIIATGLGLVYWVSVMEPIVLDTTVPAFVRAISLGYPLGDVFLFAAVARVLTGGGRRGLGVRMLLAGTAVVLISDVFYVPAAAVSTYTGGIVSAGFMFAYVLWAGAALHPSMAEEPEPTVSRPAGKVRLTALTLATLLAPAVLFVEGVRRDDIDWLAIGIGAVVLFLLVVFRMAGFVAQIRAQASQLEDLAMRDEVTGLANRRRFEARVAEALAQGGPQVALLDLTDFKNVNDRFGHAVGDRLLAAVAARLTGKLRETDLVARMGGDEFAILVPDATRAEGDAIVDRLAAALRRPIAAGDHEFLVSASIGVADADGTADPAEVLRRADVAMYAAKARGDRRRRYSADLDERATEQGRLGAEIRTALDTGQFRLVYQPIVELPGGRIVSCEALIRWEHPERGFVSPADFIPVAEQNGLIVELGAWILKTACAQAVVWRDTFGPDAPQRISVNVSARQLAEPGFADLVAETLAWTGLAAPQLIVEVTETAVFGGGQAVQAVKDLHALGVKIALDDFGTGHSSLGLLQTVPVDVLKVDKSFVDNITLAGRQAVIATALIQVADGLGLIAVAEGVETAEQADELHRLGYRLAQGYHFGKPVPEPDFARVKARV